MNMERWSDPVAWAVVGLGVVAQFVLGLFLWYDWAGLDVMTYIGWAVWVPSFALGWLPILVLRRRAGVRKGETYIHTNVLVESGLYRVVRHPQYLSMMLFAVALMLISQHWAVAVIGVAVMASVYVVMWNEDKRLVEKFGDDYKRYMKAVPRANFVVGLVRVARREARQDNTEGGASGAPARNNLSNWQDVTASYLGSALAVATIVLTVLFTNPRAIGWVQYLGLALFVAAGVVFLFHAYMLILPRRRKSWGYAGGLVDSGLYGVVRHPLYVGVIVACLGAILVGQSWLVAAVAVPGIPVMYWNMLLEERSNVGRFGDGYEAYMQRVPRANLFLGLARLLRRYGAQ